MASLSSPFCSTGSSTRDSRETDMNSAPPRQLFSSRKLQMQHASALERALLVQKLMSTLNKLEGEECTMDGFTQIEATLQDAISAVRTLKNHTSPVMRLLPETLAYIFSLIRPSYSSSFPLEQWSPEMHQWRDVTLVCRYWRDTALSYPFLWSSLHSFSRRQIKTCLQRSQDALIDIHLVSGNFRKCPTVDDEGLLDELQHEFHRLRAFHLRTLCSHDLQSSIFDYMTAPAPHLESLTIALDDDDQPSSAALPCIFGGGHLSSVRRLNMRYFTTWPENIFSNLTHLCLNRQAESSRVSLDDFLDFVETCPKLETLALIDAGPVIPDLIAAAGGPPRVIDLPRLKSIDIGHWPTAYLAGMLLRHFSFPSSTTVAVWNTSGVILTDETISTLFPSDSCHKRNLWENGLKQVRITDCRASPFVLTTGTTLQINGSIRPSQALLVLPDICAVEEIKELWLGENCGYDGPESDWKTIFGMMTGLETLVLARRSSEPVLSALALPIGNSVGSSDRPICPNLKKIVINAYAASNVSTFFLSILVQQRRAWGVPLQKLDVTVYDANDALAREIGYMKALGVSEVEFGSDFEGMKARELVPEWPTTAFNWSKAENI